MGNLIVFNLTAWDRFFSKVSVEDCWQWTGGKSPNGYGLFRPGGQQNQVSAHRAAWELLVGGIGPGLEIDHLCKNRACVNPDHLQPVTSWINCMRSASPPSSNFLKLECPRGHRYGDTNTRVYRGKRHCRACDRDRSARRRLAA